MSKKEKNKNTNKKTVKASRQREEREADIGCYIREAARNVSQGSTNYLNCSSCKSCSFRAAVRLLRPFINSGHQVTRCLRSPPAADPRSLRCPSLTLLWSPSAPSSPPSAFTVTVSLSPPLLPSRALPPLPKPFTPPFPAYTSEPILSSPRISRLPPPPPPHPGRFPRRHHCTAESCPSLNIFFSFPFLLLFYGGIT